MKADGHKVISSVPILWAMLVVLAACNLLLIRQNLQLRAQLNSPEPPSLQPGEKVPSFSAQGLRGETIEVNYGRAGRKRVLLYFTPKCPYCHGQFAYWRELLEHADRDRFEVIGIARDKEDRAKLEEYLRRYGCDGASPTPLRVALVSDEVRRSYKLSATPITLIVAGDGAVERAWEGRWDAAQAAEAGRLFGLDLSAASAAAAARPPGDAP
jgi:peroxiredoxin